MFFEDNESRRTDRRRIVLVFAIGLGVALVWTFLVFPRLSMVERAFDMDGYGAIAENLHRGNGFSLGAGPTLRRAPLYPTLMAGLFALFGLHGPGSYVSLYLLQCLFAAVTCVVAYAIARRLFGARTALLAGLLCAFWPQCLRYLGLVEVEPTMTLLITLLTWSLVRFYQAPHRRNGALFGLILGLVTLTKPVTLLFPLALVGLFIVRRKRHPGPLPWAAMGLSLGVTALLCLPWVLRNHVVTAGRFHGISSNASGEFLRGYVNARSEFALLRTPFRGHWDVAANRYEEEILRPYGFSFVTEKNGKAARMVESVDNELRKAAIEDRVAAHLVLSHPFGFIRKFVIQLGTFWYLVETPGKSLLVGSLALVAWGLAALGWRRAGAQGVEVAPVVVVVLYFNIVYAALLAFARYSMPVYPSLLVLSAYSLDSAIGKRRIDRRSAPIAPRSQGRVRDE